MMTMTQSKTQKMTLWTIGAALSVSVFGTAFAASDNDKVITQDIDVAQIKQLHLDAHVGSVKFMPSSDNQLHVYVRVSEKDGWGVFKDSPKDAELEITKDANTLTLTLNDDEYGEEWKIMVPAQMMIDADLGVGEMSVEGINTNITVDIGVGEATIQADASAYAKASAQAGVGAATVKSSSGSSDSSRALVSEDVNWTGQGSYSISAEVGVGDVSITLE